MYVVLVDPNQHFQCNDPLKFKEQLKVLSENKGEDVTEVLSYFFHRHFVVYLWHLNMIVHSEVEFTGPKNLLNDAENMSMLFKEWLGEGRYNELVKSAQEMLLEMREFKSKNEEE